MYTLCTWSPKKPEETEGFPETGVTNGLQAHMDARNQIQVLSGADSALTYYAISWALEHNPYVWIELVKCVLNPNTTTFYIVYIYSI